MAAIVLGGSLTRRPQTTVTLQSPLKFQLLIVLAFYLTLLHFLTWVCLFYVSTELNKLQQLTGLNREDVSDELVGPSFNGLLINIFHRAYVVMVIEKITSFIAIEAL